MATNSSQLIIDIKALDNVTPSLKNIQSGIIRFVGAITASLVAVRGVAFPIQEAAAFERELKNVQKTTGFTEQQIEGLGQSLNRLSTELLTSQEELAQIAATAGQLGLGAQGVQAIEQFTESVARASATFDIGADSLSSYAAQILNIFDLDVSQIENVFSAINEVSNNSVASAANLIDIIKRVGSVSGLTFTQVNALAAQSQDLGVSAEVAGTTLVKQFSRMQSEAQKFAAVMNITTEEWVARVEEDALQAFNQVNRAIGELSTAARADAIKDLFGGGRIFALAAKQVRDATNGFTLLNKSLENSRREFAAGQSSIREYAVIASSLSGQTDQLGNTFRALAIDAGQQLIPSLKEVVSVLQDFLQSEEAQAVFDSLADSLNNAIVAIRDFIANGRDYAGFFLNIIPLIKTFLTIGLGRALLRIGGLFVITAKDAAKLNSSMNILGDTWARITQSFRGNAFSGVGSSVRSAQRAVDARRDASTTVGQAAEQQKLATYKLQSAEITKQIALKRQQVNQQSLELVGQQGKLRNLQLEIANETRILQLGARQGTLTKAEQVAKINEINTLKAQEKLLQQELALNQANLRTKQIGLNVTTAGLTRLKQQNAALTEQIALRSANAALGEGVNFAAPSRANRVAQNAARNFRTAQTAATGLGSAVRALGRGIIALFTGPVAGIAITAALVFASFKDQILDFLGFVEDADQKVAESALKRSDREIRSQAKRDAEVYKKELAEELDATAGGNPVLPVDIEAQLNSANSDQAENAVKLVTDRINVLSRRITGLEGEALLNLDAFNNWNEVIAGTEAELQRVESRIAEIQNQAVATDFSISGDTDAAIERVNNTQEVRDLLAEQLELQNRLTAQQARQNELGEGSQEVLAARVAAQEELLETLSLGTTVDNREQFQYLAITKDLTDQYAILQKARQEFQTGGAELAQLEALEREGNITEDTAVKIAAKRAELAELRTAYDAATVETDKYTQRAQAQGQVLSGQAGREFKQYIDALDAAAINTLYENAAQNADALEGQAVALRNMVPSLRQAAIETENLENTLKDFRENRVIIDALNQSIKGVRDNVNSTIAAIQSGISSIIAESRGLDEINANQAELKVAVAFDYELNNIDARAEERIADLTERQIRALRRGETIYAEILGRRIQQVQAESEINRAAREAELAYQAQLELLETQIAKRDELERRGAQLLQDQADAAQKLADVQSAPEGLGDPNAVREARIELEVATRAVDAFLGETDATQKSIVDIANKLSDLGNTVKNDFTGGAFKQIIPQEDIERALETARSGATEISRVYANVAISAADGVEKSNTALNKLETSLNNAREEQLETFKALGAGAAAEIATLITEMNNLDRAGASSIETYNRLLEIINNPELAADRVGGDEGFAEAKVTISNITLDPLATQALLDDLQRTMDENAIVPKADPAEAVESVQKAFKDADFEVTVKPRVEAASGGFFSNLFASGGSVRGPGTGTSDSIPAMLSNGEYVIRAAAVQKYGVGYFDHLNQMRAADIPKYATGGLVNAVQSIATAGSDSGGDTVVVNLGGRQATLRGEKQQIKNFVDMLNNVEAVR